MRRLPPNQKNFTIYRERDARALCRLALLLLSGLVLASGFVFAAGRHFTAVRYGYESEKLRLEHGRLIEEQRRLLLAREVASAPARLEDEARKLGLQPIGPMQVEQRSSAEKNHSPTATTLAASSVSLHY